MFRRHPIVPFWAGDQALVTKLAGMVVKAARGEPFDAAERNYWRCIVRELKENPHAHRSPPGERQ